MVKIGPLEITVQTFDAEELAARQRAPPPPGRCADRIEDFFMVLSSGWNNSWQEHKGAFSTMLECLRSEEGDEPRDRYVQLPQSSPFWQDHGARPSKFARLRATEQQRQEEEAQQQQQQQQQQQPPQPSAKGPQQQQSGGQQQPGQQHQGYSWLWWWRRRPQPLTTVEAAAAGAAAK